MGKFWKHLTQQKLPRGQARPADWLCAVVATGMKAPDVIPMLTGAEAEETETDTASMSLVGDGSKPAAMTGLGTDEMGQWFGKPIKGP